MDGINVDPSRPMLPGTNTTGEAHAADAATRKKAPPPGPITDSQGRSGTERIRARNALLRPNLPSAMNLGSLLGPNGAGNAYGKPSSMTALVIAMTEMSSELAKMRFNSEASSSDVGKMIYAVGLEAAEHGWNAAVKQAEIHESNAKGHFVAAWIAGASAVMTIGSFVAIKSMQHSATKNDTALKMAKQDTAIAKQEYTNATTSRTVTDAQGNNPTKVGPMPQKAQDAARTKYTKAMEAENFRAGQIDGRFGGAVQMMSTFTGQLSQMGQEIVKGINEQEVAGLTLQKGRETKKQEVAQTFSKMLTRLEQSSEEDAKTARDLLAKFMQELTQMIDAQYKAFGIGVHG